MVTSAASGMDTPDNWPSCAVGPEPEMPLPAERKRVEVKPVPTTAATEPLIPAWSYTLLGWVRIYLRCPDHGPFCDGSACCCRDLHWRPWALLKCGRWRALKGRMFPPAPRRRRV